MAVSFVSERIHFASRKDQHTFAKRCEAALGGRKKIAAMLSVSERTIADWTRAKFSIPYATAQWLSRASNISLPAGASKVHLTDHLQYISKKGGYAVYKAYGKIGGSEKKRKAAWKAWWVAKGHKTVHSSFSAHSVCLPHQSEQLAEFFGIMLGDGGIAPYHISITLNSERDAEYALFVEQLLSRLYGTAPKRYKKKGENTINITLHRKAVVSFCNDLGLPIGNKLARPLIIPDWIQKKRNFGTACLRGLIDTDGSIYIHQYSVRGREYKYVKISFSNASPSLLEAVHSLLHARGINGKKRYTAREICIEDRKSIERYMRMVGSHNPKHRAVWETSGRVG